MLNGKTVLLGIMASGLWLGCSSKSTEPKTDADITGRVLRQEDSTAISGANVLLFDANTNSPVARVLTNVQGNFSFKAPSGIYYLTAAAQGRIPSPPLKGGKPLPFQVSAGGIYPRPPIYLDADSTAVGAGGMSGTVSVSGSANRGGILIVAISGVMAYSTVTGADGFFILYNLPPGTYTLQGYKGGLAQDTGVVSRTVSAGGIIANVSMGMSVYAGKTLQGTITFLAGGTAKPTDVTLVNLLTLDPIPGLQTMSDSSRNYILRGIPPGDYIAWASYFNDDNVMDPDRIQKFGLDTVSFLPSDTAKTLDLDVTNAISMISPTNPADTLYPATVTTLTPTFKWNPYPSTQEYVVAVFDANGTRVWGGYNTAGVILHAPIPANTDSVRFNFDGSALMPLKAGGIYTWKVYADQNPNSPGRVVTLISSSEDLRGIFKVVP